MDDPLVTVVSQYSSAPTILSLVTSINDWIDPGADLDDFYDLVWDLDTAQGYGLDVWGRIVGVGRVLNVATGAYFGFTGPSGTSGDPYDQSPFYSGGATTSNFALSDDGFRTLILAKAASNICDGSIPAINAILLMLFPGRGNCYVVDGMDMTMIYHFEFILTPVEAAIVQQSGVLPRPVGVFASVVQV